MKKESALFVIVVLALIVGAVGGCSSPPDPALVNALTAGPWYASVQPGFSIDLLDDPTTVVIAGESRFGLAGADDGGFGLFVVPALGISSSNGDTQLFTGGTLQVSVWFGL